MKLLVDSCVFINAFKEDSEFRDDCVSLLELMSQRKQALTMPAHGWFEVSCSLRRVERIDKKFKGVAIDSNWEFPLELIYIDENFLLKYGNVDIPYIKAGDHIFIVVAFVNNYPIITTDKGMAKKCREAGVSVYTPKEFLLRAQKA